MSVVIGGIETCGERLMSRMADWDAALAGLTPDEYDQFAAYRDRYRHDSCNWRSGDTEAQKEENMNVRPRLETLEARVLLNAALLAAYEATVPAQLATLASELPKTVAAATAMLDTLAAGIGSLPAGQQQQATADLQVYYAQLLAWPDEAVSLLAAQIHTTEAGITALP